MNGFKVDPSSNACTKGIWIWPKAAPSANGNSKKMETFILDCEGSQSTSRAATSALDSKLIELVLLISSALVWNSSGNIDKPTIDALGSVLKLTTDMVRKNKSSSINLPKNFPILYWVLRDFSLNLNHETPTNYLNRRLAESSPSISSFIKKNLETRCFT